MKEKCFGIIIADRDYKRFINLNRILLEDLSKNFKKVYVINVFGLKFRQNKGSIINKKGFPINFIHIKIDSSLQFLHFFKDKNFVALQFLAKSPDYFRIYYLIKKADIKNIMIMNLGEFVNKQSIDWKHLKTLKVSAHFYDKGFYYFFRILTILNIFPKIDLLFESNTKIIKNLNNGFSRKVENFFNFFEIAYFRKIVKVNSVYYQFLKKNKYKKKNKNIIFIDNPLNHPDRVKREGVVSKKETKEYYEKLNITLKNISLIFKKKIIICLHPANKKEIKYFKDFEISKKTTLEEIPNCEIAIFNLSSAVLGAVVYNKKIINLKSFHLGAYLNNIGNKYVKALNLFSINIDKSTKLNKSDCIKKMNQSVKLYKNYINTRLCPDGTKAPNSKIIEVIKKKYF